MVEPGRGPKKSGWEVRGWGRGKVGNGWLGRINENPEALWNGRKVGCGMKLSGLVGGEKPRVGAGGRGGALATLEVDGGPGARPVLR